MEATALLILPILGGYWFARWWVWTSHKCEILAGQKLYFMVASIGVGIFGIFGGLHIWLIGQEGIYASAFADPQSLPGAEYLPKSDLPSTVHLAAVSLYTFVAGLILPFPLNWLAHFRWRLASRIWEKYADNDKWKLLGISPFLWTALRNDEFEQLLAEAASRPKPLMLTTEQGKVYVGYVTDFRYEVRQRRAIVILPLLSGYRDAGTKVVIFTTSYGQIYDECDPTCGQLDHLDIEDFMVTIPMERVVSARLFDLAAYEHFKATEESADSENAVVG